MSIWEAGAGGMDTVDQYWVLGVSYIFSKDGIQGIGERMVRFSGKTGVVRHDRKRLKNA